MIYTVYRKRGEPGFLNRIGAPEFLCQPLDMDRLTDVVTFGASLSREKKDAFICSAPFTKRNF